MSSKKTFKLQSDHQEFIHTHIRKFPLNIYIYIYIYILFTKRVPKQTVFIIL